MTPTDQSHIISAIISFLETIGIPVSEGMIPPELEFLPGITIMHGGLVIDRNRLKYPGDLLHEAGHIAVLPPEERRAVRGVLPKTNHSDAEEMMAIAWSYAAAVHLEIDPRIVFHDDGYKGGGSSIAENFSEGRYFGVPMLQWCGLCLEPKQAAVKRTLPFPHMLRWLRE